MEKKSPSKNTYKMIEVDQSVESESYGSKQKGFLNWLQDKLEDEMKKESYKDYIKREKSNDNRGKRKK